MASTGILGFRSQVASLTSKTKINITGNSYNNAVAYA